MIILKLELIPKLLSDDDKKIRKFAYCSLNSFINSFPFSDDVIEAAPLIIDALDDPDVQPYPLKCITKIIEYSDCPFVCVSSLNRFVKLFDDKNDEIITMVFKCVINIVFLALLI